MYMISQNLKKVTKEMLKNKISKITSKYIDDIVESIFDNNNLDKYQHIVSNIEDKTRNMIVDIIIETINIIDDVYEKSVERLSYLNISKRKVSRNILTIFGYIQFERNYYYEKENRHYLHYFIDDLFGFEKYYVFDKFVRGLALKNTITTNQNKGAKLTNNQLNTINKLLNGKDDYNVKRQNIYYWIDKYEVPEVDYQYIETDSKVLYIMVDEKYIHEQIKKIDNPYISSETKTSVEIIQEIINELKEPNKTLLLPMPKNYKKQKNHIMTKEFVAFTGINKNHKRNVLENRHIVLTSKKKAWDTALDELTIIYDFSKFDEIKVLSDAGKWITSGIPELKMYPSNKVIHCLCEFHVKQKICRTTTNEQEREKLNKMVSDDNKKGFIEVIDAIIEKKNKERQTKLTDYKNYIVKNWKNIRNMKMSECKSSMESHISHYLAKPFSYEPKAYSSNHIEKLIKLQEYYVNGIDIFNLYINGCENQNSIIIKKEDLNFSMYEKESSNIPILQSNNSILRKVLYNIAHCF